MQFMLPHLLFKEASPNATACSDIPVISMSSRHTRHKGFGQVEKHAKHPPARAPSQPHMHPVSLVTCAHTSSVDERHMLEIASHDVLHAVNWTQQNKLHGQQGHALLAAEARRTTSHEIAHSRHLQVLKHHQSAQLLSAYTWVNLKGSKPDQTQFSRASSSYRGFQN